MDLRGLMGAWVTGWCRSREVPPPTAVRDGWRIEVGAERERVRYVLTDVRDETIAARAAELGGEPLVWMKFPRIPEEVAPLFGPAWTVDEAQHLMATPVSPAEAPVPDGCELVVETADGVTRARVLADGAVAASGRCAVVGDHVVMDQISTEAAHRRRGLATVVMAALGNAAADDGARHAVLIATADGRALYRRLGWDDVAVFTPAHTGPRPAATAPPR